MFELEKTFHFEAGHALTHHDGKCKTPHGHSYVMTLHLASDKLIADGPKKNMVIDFTDISDIVKPMIETYLDHKWLNETLQNDSPTVEFIAMWVYEHLSPKLPLLKKVSLYETSTSKVTYAP
jgi:6-pyruvoyltetrahydropterin/6-carboxytetrahydropterin synthase